MLAMTPFELSHVSGQCRDSVFRNCVIDRGPNATFGPVSLQPQKPSRSGVVKEYLLKRFVVQPKGDIHMRTIGIRDVVEIETAAVDLAVKNVLLAQITGAHGFQPAD